MPQRPLRAVPRSSNAGLPGPPRHRARTQPDSLAQRWLATADDRRHPQVSQAAFGIARCLPRTPYCSPAPMCAPAKRRRSSPRLWGRANPSNAPSLPPANLCPPASPCCASARNRRWCWSVTKPNLGNFVAAALAGERARMKIEFKKGGAACVEFATRIEPGHASLRWMLPPRVLRGLADGPAE